MSVVVIDASVIGSALVGSSANAHRAQTAMLGRALIAPQLLDLEVLSVVRKRLFTGHVAPARAETAVDVFRSMLIRRYDHAALTRRAWELRENFTPYDAAYVALAEALDVPLMSGDLRLLRAAERLCRVVPVAP
ncbi:type II toxin-antitoxin system VapC family toxin [Plantibacter sp. Mn2098]|uniref:type II toxin-antitoxin system VapC family toxin n=1 Tax=Plantibacter sp. Mn2098 TaxID=3395266 RepID=UPI003BC0D73A